MIQNKVQTKEREIYFQNLQFEYIIKIVEINSEAKQISVSKVAYVQKLKMLVAVGHKRKIV